MRKATKYKCPDEYGQALAHLLPSMAQRELDMYAQRHSDSSRSDPCTLVLLLEYDSDALLAVLTCFLLTNMLLAEFQNNGKAATKL